MSDYSLELACGCINFCKCKERERKREIKEEGFDTIGLRVSQEVYVCNTCEALTLDYVKHKGWHNDLIAKLVHLT